MSDPIRFPLFTPALEEGDAALSAVLTCACYTVRSRVFLSDSCAVSYVNCEFCFLSYSYAMQYVNCVVRFVRCVSCEFRFVIALLASSGVSVVSFVS